MIRQLVQSLIGILYGGSNSVSANPSGLPPKHRIVSEEILIHGEVRYLAMQIKPPSNGDYVKVGVIERSEDVAKDGGGSSSLRHVRIINPKGVAGLEDEIRKTGLNGEIKYDGEEVYSLVSE